MSNKKIGNDYERWLAEELSKNHFWVHLLQQNKNGQPADMIAINRKGEAFLIDCKACTTVGFELSRMEENQDLAMMKLYEITGHTGWFAIGFKNITYMVPHIDIRKLKEDGVKKLKQPNLKSGALPLKWWIETYDRDGKE